MRQVLARPALKAPRADLHISARKLLVPPSWTHSSVRKVSFVMKPALWSLLLLGGVSLAPLPPVFAAAPIPEVTGAVPSLAPMLARITPGVVGVSVRGRVREENPLLQDPFFRRFFNLPQQKQMQEHETQATGSGAI